MKVRKRNGFISIELALIAGLILSFGILITNKYIAEETQAGINMESEISDVFGSGKRNSADGGNTGETPALPDPIPEPEPEQPKEYVYIVNHWLQKPGGGMEPSTDNFILKESSGGTAIAGTTISPYTKTYSGYKTPDQQTVTITTNSQNINYYYLADSYTIDGMWRMKDNLTSISKNLTEKVEFTTAFNEEVLYEEMGVYRNPDGSYDIEVAYLDYDLSGNLQAVDTVYYFYEWDDENN